MKEVEFLQFRELKIIKEYGNTLTIYTYTNSITFRGVVGLEDGLFSSEFLSNPNCKVVFLFDLVKEHGYTYTIATDGQTYVNISWGKSGVKGAWKVLHSKRHENTNPTILDRDAINAMIKCLSEDDIKAAQFKK
jgi:hypothetical protein